MVFEIAWLRAVLVDWLIIGLAVVLAIWSLWLLPLSVLIVGNRQHALSLLGHEGGHQLVSKNRRINDWLTNVFVFYPLGINLHQYRQFHWEHHRHVNTEKDPELPLKAFGPTPMILPYSRSKIISHCLLDLLGFGIFGVGVFVHHIRPRKLTECGALAALGITSIGLVYTGYGLLVGIWLWSICTSYWMFFRIRVWSEHVGAEDTHVFDPTLFERLVLFPHNTWLHDEHHRKPSVSFNKLPGERKTITGISFRSLMEDPLRG